MFEVKMDEVDLFSKKSHYKRKGYYRKLAFLVLAFVYLASVCTSLVLKAENFRTQRETQITKREDGRLKRSADLSLEPLDADDGDDNDTECMQRAVEEFPSNFFTLKQTQDGAMAVHILLALYMFGTLAIVCDDYFVPALEAICERLNLQEDVAGATFMAAGSSAPEFFTSVIGVFISKSDVGVGTIVGSAVFNILFIIGVCAIFAGMVVKLTWYPMTRDCLFYLISVAALVVVIHDEKVHWYEAAILVVLYFIYILVMYFNRFLEKKSIAIVEKIKKKHVKNEKLDVTDTVSEERQPLSASQQRARSYTETSKTSADTETSFANKGVESSCSSSASYESPWTLPDPFPMKVYWVLMLPVKVLMFFSIPDCRRPGIWTKLYAATFIMSIVWIAAASYLMVWMITIAADALDIPDTVAGLTIIAAGTSVPDCLASVFVARDGYGDMAVSNSIGSNVFDILMCLGLPWLLSSAIIEEEGHLPIRSGGIVYSALILLSTVAFLLIAVNLAKWNLTKPFGFICLLVYLAVVTVSCLFELNVFGDFVLPICDRPV